MTETLRRTEFTPEEIDAFTKLVRHLVTASTEMIDDKGSMSIDQAAINRNGFINAYTMLDGYSLMGDVIYDPETVEEIKADPRYMFLVKHLANCILITENQKKPKLINVGDIEIRCETISALRKIVKDGLTARTR